MGIPLSLSTGSTYECHFSSCSGELMTNPDCKTRDGCANNCHAMWLPCGAEAKMPLSVSTSSTGSTYECHFSSCSGKLMTNPDCQTRDGCANNCHAMWLPCGAEAEMPLSLLTGSTYECHISSCSSKLMTNPDCQTADGCANNCHAMWLPCGAEAEMPLSLSTGSTYECH